MPAATRRTRREALASAGVALGSLAGCVTGAREPPVTMLVAGSLQDAVENGLRPALDTPVRPEARGSARAARLVAAGKRDPDVVSLADSLLFDSPLSPDWHAVFATNSIVLAYDPGSRGGRRIAEAGRREWYRPLLKDAVRLGRTDPDLDPLGYRTLFVLDLATEYYDLDADLRETIPERGQVYPETRLASTFETGAIEAAFVYRSTAVERGYPFVDFPGEIDLGSPDHAETYATVEYALPGGTVVEGRPIEYVSTARHERERVRSVFEEHVAGQYLRAFGFGIPESFPEYVGDAPGAVR